jgi:hypothetical protein
MQQMLKNLFDTTDPDNQMGPLLLAVLIATTLTLRMAFSSLM